MVYFLQPVGGGPIKIGFSDNFPVRLAQLEAHYGCSLVVLATMEGDRSRESEIHQMFAHLRFGRTEQFRPGPDLMEFIGRPLLAGPNPEAVEALPKSITYEIEKDLLRRLRYIAAYRGVHLVDFLVKALSPIVDQEFREIAQELIED